MAFEKVVGMISDVYRKSEPKTDSKGNVTGEKYTWVFRIDNRQAFLKNPEENADFSDGDEVTAVGKFQPNGSFYIWTIRNETSGTVYKTDSEALGSSSIGSYIIGVVITIVGVSISLPSKGSSGELFWGILIAAFGFLFLWLGRQGTGSV